MTTLRIDIPDGKHIPEEWLKSGRVPSLKALNEWMGGKTEEKKPRGRFVAKQGRRDDLGHSLRSKLEANTARYLRFLGYKPFLEKHPATPPKKGMWYRYEGREFEFPLKRGTNFYLCDFELWAEGTYSLWECKGYMDARSKTKLKRMAKYYPDVRIEVITQKVLHDQTKRVKSLIPEWEE